MRWPWNASTGNERGDLLAELRVLQQQRIFAALELLLLLLLLLLMLLLLMMVVLMSVLVLVLILMLLLLLRVRFRALVEHANRSVLADSVGHFRRIDPHSQLGRKQTVQYGGQQSYVRARLRDHRVHFTVDAYATVTGTAIWTIREPMVPVTVTENLRQR